MSERKRERETRSEMESFRVTSRGGDHRVVHPYVCMVRVVFGSVSSKAAASSYGAAG